MSVAFEDRMFNRRFGLGGGRMGCTLVTGFLGSGKTTLLRHLLDHRGDLRLAVLVNEFAASDVDSLLLDSARLNSAFNLSTVSLTHGCACCDVRGPFRESLLRIVNSKHNFDCLLVETSGLAKPEKLVAELEEVGISLDLTVAVVDAESFEKIISLDIVKKQLENVDLVLLNKCDLATLSQVADAEDILERLTGGAKVVRSQFCKVPLDLVIDTTKIEALNIVNEERSVPPVLSHETLPKMAFRGDIYRNPSVNVSSSKVDSQPLVLDESFPLDVSFHSAAFESEDPLSLAFFQSNVLRRISSSGGLLRAKGVLCFSEDRRSRFVFQWSGLKRVEAVSGRSWDGAPKSCLVFIGVDKSELDDIIAQISQCVDFIQRWPTQNHIYQEHVRSFCNKVTSDGRFKDPSLEKEPLVIFGLRGSPLRGIKEVLGCNFGDVKWRMNIRANLYRAHLNAALMRIVNGKRKIFLAATTSGEEYNLQILFEEGSDPDDAWNEIRLAASVVISKLCKNFCPCRSELAAHVH